MLSGFNRNTINHIHGFAAISIAIGGSALKTAYNYATGFFSGPGVLPEPTSATINQLPNPFEWINKSPAPSDTCHIYSDLTFGNNSIWSAYISDSTIKMIGSYANPMLQMAAQGAEYIPYLLEAPRVYSLAKDVYHGRFKEGALKVLNVSASGMISFAVSEYGIIALPVGLISKYGIEKAFEYYYRNPVNANEQFENFPAKVQLTNFPSASRYQLVSPSIIQLALPVFNGGSISPTFMNSLALIDRVDVEQELVHFEGSDIPVPFTELNALHNLFYVDLPKLVEYGIIEINLSSKGDVTFNLNKEAFVDSALMLNEAAKSLVRMLKNSPAQSSTDLMASTMQNSIVAQGEDALPVQTNNGVIFVRSETIGQIASQAFNLEHMVTNPGPNGELLLRVSQPSSDKSYLPSRPTIIEVPVREVQEFASTLVEAKEKSIAEQQQDLLHRWGY